MILRSYFKIVVVYLEEHYVLVDLEVSFDDDVPLTNLQCIFFVSGLIVRHPHNYTK